jgi:hypothetical protein
VLHSLGARASPLDKGMLGANAGSVQKSGCKWGTGDPGDKGSRIVEWHGVQSLYVLLSWVTRLLPELCVLCHQWVVMMIKVTPART